MHLLVRTEELPRFLCYCVCVYALWWNVWQTSEGLEDLKNDAIQEIMFDEMDRGEQTGITRQRWIDWGVHKGVHSS